MKMPLGRYEDKEVHSLPSDYLKWLMENWEDGGDIQEEAEEEFNRRTDERSHFYE